MASDEWFNIPSTGISATVLVVGPAISTVATIAMFNETTIYPAIVALALVGGVTAAVMHSSARSTRVFSGTFSYVVTLLLGLLGIVISGFVVVRGMEEAPAYGEQPPATVLVAVIVLGGLLVCGVVGAVLGLFLHSASRGGAISRSNHVGLRQLVGWIGALNLIVAAALVATTIPTVGVTVVITVWFIMMFMVLLVDTHRETSQTLAMPHRAGAASLVLSVAIVSIVGLMSLGDHRATFVDESTGWVVMIVGGVGVLDMGWRFISSVRQRQGVNRV